MTQGERASIKKGTTQLLDPFMELPAYNAAEMIGIEPYQRLEHAVEGDPDFVPYVPHQGRRAFLLGDVLTAAANRTNDPPPQLPSLVVTTLEKARAVMRRRVGPAAAWHDENRHRSNEDVPSPSERRKPVEQTVQISKKVKQALASGSMLGVFVAIATDDKTPKQKKRGARVKLHSGATVVDGHSAYRNISRFSSLGDFLQNAVREDQWLFAVPPQGQGRPYDFVEALLAGDTDTPWKAMTYVEYLQAMLAAAIADEGIWIGESEQQLLKDATRPVDS